MPHDLVIKNGFVVTYTVDEGPEYKFGKVSVETELQKLDKTILEALVPFRSGQIYEDEKIEQATDAAHRARCGDPSPVGVQALPVLPQPKGGTPTGFLNWDQKGDILLFRSKRREHVHISRRKSRRSPFSSS